MDAAGRDRLPTIDDVRDAARRLAGHARRTPLLESAALNDRLGGRLLVKAEPLQLTGSFKFRGAFTRLSRLAPGERARGVVAYSSGNHAQGVAAAARHFGVPATLVMPADAPAVKVAGTRARGAEVVFYDRGTEDREAIGARLQAETGAILVKPYDDPDVISGQGTVGLEVAADLAAAETAADAFLCPCGGGGLVAGCALALAAESPATAVWAVEPAGFDDTRRSLAAGKRLANAPGAASACDALLAPEPGALTFAINRERLAGGLAVTDRDAFAAMRAAFEHFKVVTEPGGAVALAAVLSGGFDTTGRTVVVVLSGGNVDPLAYRAALDDA